MNFHSNASSDDSPDINLIPLIDVLLVMLIFLAATTTFTRERQLSISLPQANAEQTTVSTIEVSIAQDGRYALAGVPRLLSAVILLYSTNIEAEVTT
jgi:biopolymer transport protein ExbD